MREKWLNSFFCIQSRYSVMKRCWKLAPDERLRFSDLVVRVDKILQSVGWLCGALHDSGEARPWGGGGGGLDWVRGDGTCTT